MHQFTDFKVLRFVYHVVTIHQPAESMEVIEHPGIFIPGAQELASGRNSHSFCILFAWPE
jgi:hypothetical protein